MATRTIKAPRGFDPKTQVLIDKFAREIQVYLNRDFVQVSGSTASSSVGGGSSSSTDDDRLLWMGW